MGWVYLLNLAVMLPQKILDTKFSNLKHHFAGTWVPKVFTSSKERYLATHEVLSKESKTVILYARKEWIVKLIIQESQLSLTNPRDAKACQNCSNSTCLQRCRWQYWPIFMRLTAIESEIREIPRNSLKIQTYGVQGHPRSSILVSIESPYMTSY